MYIDKISRRKAIAGLGAGLTSVVAVPAFASGINSEGDVGTFNDPIEDPTKKISCSSFPGTVAALARACLKNESAARPR